MATREKNATCFKMNKSASSLVKSNENLTVILIEINVGRI